MIQTGINNKGVPPPSLVFFTNDKVTMVVGEELQQRLEEAKALQELKEIIDISAEVSHHSK